MQGSNAAMADHEHDKMMVRYFAELKEEPCSLLQQT